MALNLAADPFRNLRPLRRAGVGLIVLGLVLAAVDARTYWRHFTGENLTRVELQRLDADLSAEREELERLQAELSRLDLEALNQRAEFVNDQIAQRTFSWSGLFDHLVDILPNEAHLLSLEPLFERNRRSRRDLDLRDGEVMLELDGVARDTERLLALIDAFFAHPSFREPDLQREALREGTIEFALSVIYRPGMEPEPEPAAPPAAEDPAESAVAVDENQAPPAGEDEA